MQSQTGTDAAEKAKERRREKEREFGFHIKKKSEEKTAKVWERKGKAAK